MFDRTGNYLIYAILLSMILGVVFVAIFGEAGLHVKFLGDMFLAALKMVVIPLLFFSMVVGISNLGDIRKLGRTGVKTLLYFLATSAIAVVIGLILVNLIQPGSGFTLPGVAAPETIGHQDSYSFFRWLTDQIPSNILKAAAETKVLPVIVFALIFGGVLTTIGSKGRTVISFCDAVNDVFMKIVHLIMWFAPIGIFGLVAGQLAAEGGLSQIGSVVTSLGKYSAVVVIGLLIHGVIILPLILKFIAGKSPVQYFIGMSQALMTAFTTASSSATLPVTMDCVEEKNDVDKRASSFVLPLGATINMDGTALYEAVAALFIAQAYGISLGIFGQITICLTAVLASIGAAGIPQAGLVTMVLVLQAVGLPLEGIGLILSIDWLLDRFRTTVNVWGDSIGAAVIATTAEIGLVDRRRRMPEKSSWLKSSITRRKEAPRNRQDPKSLNTVRGEKTSTVPGRGSAAGKFNARSAEKRGGKSSRTTNKPVKRIHKVDSSPLKGVREEYGPQDNRRSLLSDEPIKKKLISGPERFQKTIVKPMAEPKVEPVALKSQPRASTTKAETAETSAISKSTFGRHQRKPSPAKKKPDSKFGKNGSVVEKAEPVSNSVNTFEVPKFPSSMLDDLKIPDSLKNLTADDTSASEDSSASKKTEVELEQKTPVPESVDNEINNLVADDDSNSTVEKSEKDFTLLDKAILGDIDSEKPRSSVEDESAEVKGKTEDFGVVESEMKDKLTLSQADYSHDDSEAIEVRPSVVDEESRQEPVDMQIEDVQVSPEIESLSEGFDNSTPSTESLMKGSRDDSRPDSITKNNEPTDEEASNEPLEWGRPKRKRNLK
ncbi:MAG: cation:dicarboxylase symporter family transporter [Candidatus Zixiibacteriota bacterium]